MHRITLIIAVLAATALTIGVSADALALECNCHGGLHGLGARACAGSYYGMQPGCCECPPSPCDNAWAGYCDEKAKCRAFWHRFGTGWMCHDKKCCGSFGCKIGWKGGCVGCTPTPACSPCAEAMTTAPAEATPAK